MVKLPNIPAKIVSAEVVGGGNAEVRQLESGIEISVASKYRNPNDTVIALKLDSPAMNIAAMDVVAPVAAKIK